MSFPPLWCGSVQRLPLASRQCKAPAGTCCPDLPSLLPSVGLGEGVTPPKNVFATKCQKHFEKWKPKSSPPTPPKFSRYTFHLLFGLKHSLVTLGDGFLSVGGWVGCWTPLLARPENFSKIFGCVWVGGCLVRGWVGAPREGGLWLAVFKKWEFWFGP